MRDELHTVRIRISAAWVRCVDERIWHESQRAEKLPDGGLELAFQAAGLEEISRWVLSLGPEAYVAEPEELRKKVKMSLEKVLEKYTIASETIERESLKRDLKHDVRRV